MSNQAQDSDFDWLANIYTMHSAINHPSELHGILLGHLAGAKPFDRAAWLNEVIEHMEVDGLDSTRQANIEDDLFNFCDSSQKDIEKDSSNLQLLLPDDDYPLHERMESLVMWVRGFLEGLAISVGKKLVEVDGDLQEMIRDFVEITQMDSRATSDESNERDFFEVCEYVRIGVLNLYAEFNAPPPSASNDPEDPTLH